MRRYLGALLFWTLFLWLALSANVAVPAIGLVLTLDYLANH